MNLEIDRLDDVLRVAQLELSESGDTPSLTEETRDYVPMQTTRELALAKLKVTLQSLDDVRESLQSEKVSHRDLVYELKKEIKKTRSDIEAIDNGSYEPAVEFERRLSDRREAQANEMESKRRAIKDEIGALQANITKDTLVHDANVSSLQAEKMELEQKLANMTNDNSSSMLAIESTLSRLKEEQAENYDILLQLEKRLSEEQQQEKILKEMEEQRLKRDQEKEDNEEKQYFAALWIQLRWKAYLKRKALKQSKSKKGKKGGKKSKKK